MYSLAEACELARQGCCLEGVPDLRRGLLCTNGGGGLTGAMDGRFTVYLQLSICGLSMARPPSLLICIFFLGDTGDGDALLSPSPPPLEGEPLSEEVILSLQGNNSGM